ncbi:MAG: response regulator transcription factor [Thermodesulfobacteriota bacterium]
MFTIMIIEGNDLFRNTLKDILTDGFPQIRILEAESGEDALQQLDGGDPNLIFMEVKLPGQNGLDIAKTLKNHHPKVHIIVISGMDSPEYREAAENQGVEYFFSKKTAKPEDITNSVIKTLNQAGINHP